MRNGCSVEEERALVDALGRRGGRGQAAQLRQRRPVVCHRRCGPPRARSRTRARCWPTAGTAARGGRPGRHVDRAGQPHVRRVGVHGAGVMLALDRGERAARLERVRAAPWLANCGNSSAGSTSLVGWSAPASSSGLSPVTPGHRGSRRSRQRVGYPLDRRRVGDVGPGVRAEVVLPEVVGQDQAVLEEPGCRRPREITHSASGSPFSP